MRKKNYKGRCVKRLVSKSKEVCRSYDKIHIEYLNQLEENPEIKEIHCNVLLDNFPSGEYTTDFVCVKTDGDLLVRECVFRKLLLKPLTVKLLDASREYWIKRGVTDWGIVTDGKE